MNLIELFVAALAIWQIVEIWHHGELFADRHSKVENWRGGVKGWLGVLLTCPWCTSVWIGFLVCGNLELSRALGHSWVAFFPYAFAMSRLANLGNDLTHRWCRTPRGVPDPGQPGDPINVFGEGGSAPPDPASLPADPGEEHS